MIEEFYQACIPCGNDFMNDFEWISLFDYIHFFHSLFYNFLYQQRKVQSCDRKTETICNKFMIEPVKQFVKKDVLFPSFNVCFCVKIRIEWKSWFQMKYM